MSCCSIGALYEKWRTNKPNADQQQLHTVYEEWRLVKSRGVIGKREKEKEWKGERAGEQTGERVGT